METIIFYSSKEAMRIFGTWEADELRQFFEFNSPGFGRTIGKHTYTLEEDAGSMQVNQETPWFSLDDPQEPSEPSGPIVFTDWNTFLFDD
jgi:hypothetical protein